jgi:hypothetical protein
MADHYDLRNVKLYLSCDITGTDSSSILYTLCLCPDCQIKKPTEIKTEPEKNRFELIGELIKE